MMGRDVLVWILGILDETGIWGAGEVFCALAKFLGFFWTVGVRVEECRSNLEFEVCPVA